MTFLAGVWWNETVSATFEHFFPFTLVYAWGDVEQIINICLFLVHGSVHFLTCRGPRRASENAGKTTSQHIFMLNTGMWESFFPKMLRWISPAAQIWDDKKGERRHKEDVSTATWTPRAFWAFSGCLFYVVLLLFV